MSGGVPAGWVLVPVKPTEAMQNAGLDARMNASRAWASKAEAFWSAMLATTPTPPPSRDADVEREARFLLDRLVDHEVRMTSEQDAREWHGHVTPSMARLRAALQAFGERG